MIAGWVFLAVKETDPLDKILFYYFVLDHIEFRSLNIFCCCSGHVDKHSKVPQWSAAPAAGSYWAKKLNEQKRIADQEAELYQIAHRVRGINLNKVTYDELK